MRAHDGESKVGSPTTGTLSMPTFHPSEPGAYAVLINQRSPDGLVKGAIPIGVLGFLMADGRVVGYVTAQGNFQRGVPVWEPEGTVSSAFGAWSSPRAYIEYMLTLTPQ